LGLAGIPAASEEVTVARDLILSEKTGTHLHVCHVSTAGSVALIRDALAKGVKVSAETAPHYFTLTDEAMQPYDANFKMNPPLRSDNDRQAIIEGLRDGTLGVIATDHAPHADYEKEQEISYAPFGIVGLETAVGLAVAELVEKKVITVKDLVIRMSVNPAKILGLAGRGQLGQGAAADVTVVDLNKEWVVDKTKFESKSRNTPFNGRKLKGEVWMTIVGGDVVFKDGKIL
ncbi:MAG TPA: amidohydrolase family protein, partial [bacterium]|nr:amidohydrolase family protein [bacterium]